MRWGGGDSVTPRAGGTLADRINGSTDAVLAGKNDIRNVLLSKGADVPENPTFAQLVAALQTLGDNVLLFTSNYNFTLTITPESSVKETFDVGTNKVVILTSSDPITYTATIDNAWWNGYTNSPVTPSQQVTGVNLNFVPKYGFGLDDNSINLPNITEGFGVIQCCFSREGEPNIFYMMAGPGGVSGSPVTYKLLKFDLQTNTYSLIWNFSDPYYGSMYFYPDSNFFPEEDAIYFSRISDGTDRNIRYAVRKLDLKTLSVTELITTGAYYVGSTTYTSNTNSFRYQNSIFFVKQYSMNNNREMYKFDISTKALTKPYASLLPINWEFNYDLTHYLNNDWLYENKAYCKIGSNLSIYDFVANTFSSGSLSGLISKGINPDNIRISYLNGTKLNFIGTMNREPLISGSMAYNNTPYKVSVTNSYMPIGVGFIPNFNVYYDSDYTPIGNGYMYIFKNMGGSTGKLRKIPLTYFD